jgi:hypothetical protein
MTIPSETLVAQHVADIKTFLDQNQAQHINPLKEEQQHLEEQSRVIWNQIASGTLGPGLHWRIHDPEGLH